MKIEVNDDSLKRLDVFISENSDISRSQITKLIKDGHILVNGKKVKTGYTTKMGDVLDIDYVKEGMVAKPEKMDLDIVYEDEDLLVVNKANGVVVHPAPGNYSGTLVNGLLYHFKNNLSTINGEERPGIVHRIDADTTGLLVIAKNDKTHEELAKQFANKTNHRVYYALVWGVIENDTGTIDAPIGRDSKDRKKMCVTDVNSKEAITHFKVLERYKNATLLELKLETGRTHQIRVHMKYIGHPVVNDAVYSNKKVFDETGQCLHAKELGFIHPRTGKYMEFDSELPECFINIQNILKNE